MMNDIKDQLAADAAHVQKLLMTGGKSRTVEFYEHDTLRVFIPSKKYNASQAVLSRDLRVMCLNENMKLDRVTMLNCRDEDGHITVIKFIYGGPGECIEYIEVI
jgi:hypothetical protein